METEQVVFIHRRRLRRVWCEHCSCEVELVGLEEAGAFFDQAPRMSPSKDGARGWHWSQASDGTACVCLKSLLDSPRCPGA